MNNKQLDFIIEKSFGSEPEFKLSADFAFRVTAGIARQSQWKTDLKDYLYLTGFTFFLLATTAGTYYYISRETLNQIFALISGNILPLIYLVILLNFVLFVDQVGLPYLFTRRKINQQNN